MAMSAVESQTGKVLGEVPLAGLIRQLLADHEVWRGKDFPVIEDLFDRIESAYGGPFPACLKSLRRAFFRFRSEMEGHMSREENVLFPAIIQAEQAESAAKPAFGSIKNPITMLEDDHDHDRHLLEEMRQAAHGYKVPDQAPENLDVLFRKLQALEAAMHAHTKLESSILFARALQGERG